MLEVVWGIVGNWFRIINIEITRHNSCSLLTLECQIQTVFKVIPIGDWLVWRTIHTTNEDWASIAHDFQPHVAACTFLYKLFYLPPLRQLRSLLPPKAPVPSQPTRLATSSIQGHSHQLETGLPIRSNSSSLRAFPACVVPIWNALPKSLLKDAPTAKKMQSFKVGVHKHLLRKNWFGQNRLALAPAPPILPYIITSLYSLLLNPSSTHKCQHPPTPMVISSP